MEALQLGSSAFECRIYVGTGGTVIKMKCGVWWEGKDWKAKRIMAPLYEFLF